MFRDLTIQQLCALDYKRNMVVTSGPGAGKTRILSHRYCFILLTDEQVSIPQILTLTFTEKSAEEMKGRIYRMLRGLDRELAPGADDYVKRKIREARERFHNNRISTIHSFCANLLREHPVEAGIDPGFSVIQGARQRELMGQAIGEGISSLWRKDKEKLMPLFQSFGGRRNLMSALRSVIDHPLSFQRSLETGRELFEKEDWEKQVFREYCGMIKDKIIAPYLEALEGMDDEKGRYEELLSVLKVWRWNAERDEEYFAIPVLFQDLRRIAEERKAQSSRLPVKLGSTTISYLDLVDEFYPDIFYSDSPDSIFEKEFKLFMDAAAVCLDRYQIEKERINSLDFADLETRSFIFLKNLYESGDRTPLKRIQQRFRHIMVDEFQDTNRIQWEIIRLLCTDKGEDEKEVLQPGKLFVVGDKRQAIYRFRGGDVTVFESVTEKIRESNPEEPAVMFWNDEDMTERVSRIHKGYAELLKKRVEEFDALPSSEKEEIVNGDIYLPHNFRSDLRPIRFFNTAFKEIFGNKGAERFEKYETPPKMIFMPEGSEASPGQTGSVSFYLNQALSSSGARAETEAAMIADILEGIIGKKGKDCHEYLTYPGIREMIENGRQAVGILFFRFSHLKIFESVLREAGLPFVVNRGKGFYRCPEVMELLQLLKYIIDERQLISLLSALRSPVFGITDPEVFDLFYGREVTVEQFLGSPDSYVRETGKQILTWRFLSNRLTITELIRKIVSDRSLVAIHSVHPNGIQRLANIEKLIETARNFQSEGSSMSEFVDYCLMMADEEEEEGEALIVSDSGCPISLMTIHAAKGLEFPMVIIPDLDRRLPARPETGRSFRLYPSEEGGAEAWNPREGEMPVWRVEIPGLNYLKEYTPLGQLLKRRDKLESMAENRRVFYVGCTRAMNHLIMVGSMRKSMMEEAKAELTTDDYRERATILELMDDIYRFNMEFPPHEKDTFTGSEESPSVLWRSPEPRKFRGILYEKTSIDSSCFGTYDDRIKDLDLTSPIQPMPYFQLSFKAVSIFKECPVRFYYSFVLGVRGEERATSGPWDEEGPIESGVMREDDELEVAGNALLLGTLVHDYLERHSFGDPLNEKLLDNAWKRLDSRKGGAGDIDEACLKGVRDRARKQLERTVSDERLVNMLGKGESYREIPFLFTISRGVEFRGVIDRLFRKSDKDPWSIIDWKSNDLKRRSPEDVARENDYFLQLACYKLAVERILGEKVEGLYIYFTDSGHLLESVREVDPVKVVEDILEKVRAYEDEGDQWMLDFIEANRDSGECRFCEYKDVFC